MTWNTTINPSAADVQTVLQTAAYWPTDSDAAALALDQCENEAAAALCAFELDSGWRPFLCSGAPETRAFDAPGASGVVVLDGGLLQLDSLAVGGAAYSIGANVWAEPGNAARYNEPYLRLRFSPALCELCRLRRQCVAVTGLWGRCLAWPENAFSAVVRRAAAQVLLALDVPQALAARMRDGFSENYDVVGALQPRDVAAAWLKTFERTASAYRRVDVG